MKRKLYLTFILILMMSFTPIYGEENDFPKFGLGMNFSFNFLFGTSLSTYNQINFPIILSSEFLIEPEIFRATTSSEEKSSETGEVTSSDSSETQGVGLGIFYRKYDTNFGTYYGFRYGMIETKSSSKSTFSFFADRVKTSEKGTYLAPAFGTEYFLSNHFSMGGEIQYYTSSTTGTETETDIDEFDGSKEKSTTKISNSFTATIAQIIFRWYF